MITQDVKTSTVIRSSDLMKRTKTCAFQPRNMAGIIQCAHRARASKENSFDHFHFTPIGSAKVAQMICTSTQRPVSSRLAA